MVGLAIVLDIVILGGLVAVKLQTDMLIVAVAATLITVIYFAERKFLSLPSSHPQAAHRGH